MVNIRPNCNSSQDKRTIVGLLTEQLNQTFEELMNVRLELEREYNHSHAENDVNKLQKELSKLLFKMDDNRWDSAARKNVKDLLKEALNIVNDIESKMLLTNQADAGLNRVDDWNWKRAIVKYTNMCVMHCDFFYVLWFFGMFLTMMAALVNL